MRKMLLPSTALLGLALFLPAAPAHAVSKEIIQLQTQVQSLQDMLQQMQQSNSAQIGVLTHIVQQESDSINSMTAQLNALGAKVDALNQNSQVSGQIQGLNDSIDELKAHLSKIDATLTAIQSQLQNVNAAPASTAAPSGAPAQAPPPDQGQQPQDTAPAQPQGGGVSVPLSGGSQPQAMNNGAPDQTAPQASPQAPPVTQLYQSALSDYNGARYDLASSEFADVIKNYPQSDQAGSSSFYLGEIAYRQGLYPMAIRNYNVVLNQYPASGKVPAAMLRKGEAELASSQRDGGIRDLRALVSRYPVTPEGAQARSLLNGMGVRLVARKPTPYDNTQQ